MTATYTFEAFCTLDGFGSHDGSWGPYWRKDGPEFEQQRIATYTGDRRLVLGADTFRLFQVLVGSSRIDDGALDPVNRLMRAKPATVVSSTLEGPFDWPDATVVAGDAAEVVARMKEESDVPIVSHGSLRLNRALMAAGLVDRVQLSILPVITGRTGTEPVFGDAGDFDLELLSAQTFDGHTQHLVYRPTVHA